ncbi:hypothetical protein GCM10022226_29050 [Sphaerisporangium flaviroseum]|uniref:Uncharacterized protein n=1 Tax=Sphaerisporangium flaviroseum TaxID=509199 RepID=A0ABP7I5N4_9ACTN
MTSTDRFTSTTAADELTTTAITHLQELGDHLQARGLHVRVGTTSNGIPQLIVVSTTVPTLSEVIFAAPRQGSWWYWWSWAERIASVDELPTTVTRVCQALTPVRRHE